MNVATRAAGIIAIAMLGLTGCQQQSTESTDDSARKPQRSTPVANKSSDSDGSVVIGVAGPFTGDSAEFGVQIKMGLDLGLNEVNEAGGINDRKVQLKEMDDAGNPTDAQTVATELANDPSVVAVIGHFNSSCTLAGKDAYTHGKVVAFSAASTNVRVTKDTDYVYRNIFTDEFQGQSLANYVGNVLKLKNVAILFENDDYGSGLKDSFRLRGNELKLNVVAETAFQKDAQDFRSQLETVRSSNPDIILIAGLYRSAAVIAKQARELGINTQLIGGDGVFSQQYIDLGEKAAEGTYVTCPFLFDLGGESGKRFAEAFRKKFNKEPDAWAALAYDAFMIIVDGLRKHGVSREAVLEHLKSINSVETAYDGLTGKTFFDAEGDCKKPVQVAQVKGGKFVAAELQLSPDGQAMRAAELIETSDSETTGSETATEVPASSAETTTAIEATPHAATAPQSTGTTPGAPAPVRP